LHIDYILSKSGDGKIRGISRPFLLRKGRFGAVSPGFSVTFTALHSQKTPCIDGRVNRNTPPARAQYFSEKFLAISAYL
jgi:hypothetical protein